jgi:uncharacterized protein (TIGR02646 family)
MIHIDRGPAPATLTVYSVRNRTALDGVTKVTRAEQELELASVFFTDPDHYRNDQKVTDKKFAFEVYKDPELMAALEAVFGKKCAYCESRCVHVGPRDVEHFRPKSEIKTGAATLRPGYYWLAGEWDNLLVSCQDCNRARNHAVPGQARKAKLGKASQFPLSDENRRRRARGSLAAEEPARLLLHPCIDQPEDHLTFDEEGLIHPKDVAGRLESPQGKTSITVYALQRKTLVEERLKELNNLRFQFEQLDGLVRTRNNLKTLGANQTALDDNEGQIRAVVRQIKSLLTPDGQYLGMLREWIRAAHQRGSFARLLQFGIQPLDLIR